MPKPKRVGSGNQYKKLARMNVRPHVVSKTTKRKGSHNTKQYQATRNERRKAENRLKVLQAQLAGVQSQAGKARINQQIQTIQDAIESTRMYSQETGKLIRTRQEVASNLQNLVRLNQEYGTLVKSQTKSNKATQIEINKASTGKSTIYTQEQVHMFYRATQRAWENAAPDKRNEAILAYYGERSLRKVFEEVINSPDNQRLQHAIDVLEHARDYSEEDVNDAMQVLQDNEDEFTVSPPDGATETPDYNNVSPYAPN